MKPITKKIEGLRLCEASTPLVDHFNAVVDLDGPWTSEMLEEHAESCPIGVHIWEGSCTISTWTDEEFNEFTFDGAWRRLTVTEALLLADGSLPLRGMSLDERFEIKSASDPTP